ncbi:MAG: right-handed parallel beta-helix repeat-containing protein [Hyphomonadaceae bacterium]|nr:right-handed parallel beta-helix repeat-containing protein [Hyphomonadaceae bacterium]
MSAVNAGWLAGSANATAGLQAILDAGNSLYLPAGPYITDALTLSYAGQRVFGDGASTILRQRTAGGHLLIAQASDIELVDFRAEGIESAAGNGSFAVYTAQANPAVGLKIRRLKVSGADGSHGFNNAIKVDGSCDHALVEGCTIERLWGGTSGNGYGVLGAGNFLRVLNNDTLMANGRGRHGIYFSAGCSDSVAQGNLVTGSTFEGITQYSQGGQSPCARNVIDGNRVLGCVTASNSSAGAIGVYGHAVDTRITHNTVTDSGEKGIVCDGTTFTDLLSSVVEGNTVLRSDTIGIDFIAVQSGTIRRNHVHESSQDSPGYLYSNIRLISDNTTACVDTFVEGNRSTGTSFARSPFQINPSTPVPTGTRLWANYFPTCATAGIETNGVSCTID